MPGRRRIPKHLRLPSRLQLGKPIVEARRAVGLTQESLGQRIGLKGRAIYRWERNETAPNGRHRRELIREIHLLNQQAGLALQTAFNSLTGKTYSVVADATTEAPANDVTHQQAPIASHSPFVTSSKARVTASTVGFEATDALEFAVLKLADELDVAPRRARRALARLFERLGSASLSLDSLHSELVRAVAQD